MGRRWEELGEGPEAPRLPVDRCTTLRSWEPRPRRWEPRPVNRTGSGEGRQPVWRLASLAVARARPDDRLGAVRSLRESSLRPFPVGSGFALDRLVIFTIATLALCTSRGLLVGLEHAIVHEEMESENVNTPQFRPYKLGH
jgi:hypothetical protein